MISNNSPTSTVSVRKGDGFPRALALACAALAGASLYFVAPKADAQSSATGVPNAMQGFSQNRGKPVQIDASNLEVRDKDKAATFSGDVKVVQGDTIMTSKTLVVFYEQNEPAGGAGKQPAKQPAMKSAAPGPGGSSQIRRLEARGGVKVIQKDQTVTGETAIFDMKTNAVTMAGAGGVLLTQGKNVIRADRLMVDLTTSISRLECDAGKRCVSALVSTDKQDGPTLPTAPLGNASSGSTPQRAPTKGSAPMQIGPR